MTAAATIDAFTMAHSSRGRPLTEHFWKWVVPTEGSECWIWGGPVRTDGYGAIRFRKKHLGAHRVSYELHKGGIPEGMHIDHLCTVRRCVNPDHLEAVTQAENNRRTSERQTTCRRAGHDLTNPENVGWRMNAGVRRRYCKACNDQRRRQSALPMGDES